MGDFSHTSPTDAKAEVPEASERDAPQPVALSKQQLRDLETEIARYRAGPGERKAIDWYPEAAGALGAIAVLLLEHSKAMAIALHFDLLNASAIHACREACRTATGGNAAFVDDDVASTIYLLMEVVRKNGVDLKTAIPEARAALSKAGA